MFIPSAKIQNKKSEQCKLFRSACFEENLLTAQWLVDTFELNMKDLRKRGSLIIADLYSDDKSEAIKWLFEKFELKVKGVTEEKKVFTLRL